MEYSLYGFNNHKATKNKEIEFRICTNENKPKNMNITYENCGPPAIYSERSWVTSDQNELIGFNL